MTGVFRWSIVAWVAVLAAGCNLVFGLDETSPRDASGKDGRVDAAIDAVNPNDLDGDGVLNEQDRCVNVPNPDQHDEEGDGYGDVCDNCPQVGNVDQEDKEEAILGLPRDGVGDACDPNPESPGDRLVFFDGFGTLRTDWTERGGGMWKIIDDHLAQVDPAARKTLRFFPAATYDEVDVDTHFHVKELASSVNGEPDPERSIGVAFRIGEGGRTALVCRWGSNGKASPTYQVRLAHRTDGKDADLDTPDPTAPFFPKLEMDLEVRVTPLANPKVDCDVVGTEDLRGSVDGDDNTVPPGSVGLTTDGAVAWFDYLAVYVRDKQAP